MFVKLGVFQSNLYLEVSISVTLEKIVGEPGAPEIINILHYISDKVTF